MIFICCFMAILSRRKPPGPRNMRKFWSNSRVHEYKATIKDEVRTALTPKVLKSWWGRRLKRGVQTQENDDNPMIAPQDYDVRQSGRGLKLQHRDLYLRPTYLSWHFSCSCDQSWDALQKLQCKVTREVEGQRGQDRGSQETEDSEKKWWKKKLHQMEVSILDLDYFILIFCLARMEPRRDTWAFFLAVSWLGTGPDQVREATVWQSHFSWQRGHLHRSFQGHPWRRKPRLCVTEYIFSPFLPLVLFAVSDVWDCHSSFSCHKHDPVSALLLILFTSWLKGQIVRYTLCDFIHIRFDEKGISLRLSLLSPSCWPVVSIDPEEKESLQFLWVLVQCLLYSRRVRFSQKEQNNHHTRATVRFTRETLVTSDSRCAACFDLGDVKVERDSTWPSMQRSMKTFSWRKDPQKL